MFHRCSFFLLALSLAVSGGPAWATSVFVNVGATNTSSTTDLQAIPTGVATGGAAVMAGAQTANASYYDVCYYSGGAAGTMKNVLSQFTSTISGAGAASRTVGDSMNDQGDFTSLFFVTAPQVGWLTTNGGTTVTSFAQNGSSVTSSYQTRALGIDDNDDIAGIYTTSGSNQLPYIRTGGTVYALPYNGYTSTYATALNTQGNVCGYAITGNPLQDHAVVWTYSGSPTTATETGVNTIKNAVAAVSGWSGVEGTTALAINSPTSGGAQVVVTANTVNNEPRGELDTGVFVYNTSTQAATLLTSSSLGNLLVYDTWGNTPGEGGGHEQCINNAGQVVGYTGTQGNSWRASIWDGTTITDLNTTYAGILPSNVTLNCASAIDNNGDIAGICTVGSSTYQPFVIFSAVPEPSSVVLLVAGLVGLLVCAWRKQK